MKVIGYVRVSTREQGSNGHGLDAQRRAIQDACEQRGWELLRFEQDVSTGTKANGRKGLARALRDVTAGSADGLVVSKLDRLSRSLSHFAGLVEEAHTRGWNLVSLAEGFDLSAPHGRAMASMAAVFAQLEADLISERTKDALAEARAKGVKLGRPGLSAVPEAIAEDIREMRRRGYTLQAICDDLNEQGIPTAQGGKLWRPSALSRVLADPRPPA